MIHFEWINGNSFNECKHYWQHFTRNDPKYGCNLKWNYFLGIWCAMIFTSFAFDLLRPNGISTHTCTHTKNRCRRLNIRKCWFKMINSHLSVAICSTFGYFIFCLHIFAGVYSTRLLLSGYHQYNANTQQSVIYLVFVCNINETMSATHLCSLFVSFARLNWWLFTALVYHMLTERVQHVSTILEHKHMHTTDLFISSFFFQDFIKKNAHIDHHFLLHLSV